MSARDELALELFIADNSNQPREASIADWEWFESADKQRGQLEHYKNMAAGMTAKGYRKPRTICFVILDGDASPQARYATKAAAEEVRDAWVTAHESAGAPYNFRVAEIVEPTR